MGCRNQIDGLMHQIPCMAEVLSTKPAEATQNYKKHRILLIVILTTDSIL